VAARNVLLDNKLELKLCDLGMARYGDGTPRPSGSALGPLKWWPPSAIRDGSYCFATDMWSWAVCAVEILTKGADPWEGHSALEVGELVVKEGRTHDIPGGCPGELAAVLRACWAYGDADRPSAQDVVKTLKEMHSVDG
jgi:serine/threonine protein kinase